MKQNLISFLCVSRFFPTRTSYTQKERMSYLVSRNGLTSIPRQAVEDTSTAEPHAVLARHQHAIDVDRSHRQPAIVHALERRCDLDDVAPENSFRQCRTRPAAARRNYSSSGSDARTASTTERSDRSSPISGRGGSSCRGMVVAEGCRPRVRRKRGGRREMRFVKRLRTGVEVVDKDDRCVVEYAIQ